MSSHTIKSYKMVKKFKRKNPIFISTKYGNRSYWMRFGADETIKQMNEEYKLRVKFSQKSL